MARKSEWEDIIFVLVLFAFGAGSCLLPRFVKQKDGGLFSIGNMFSAGVLLSAAIVHQLADAQDSALNSGAMPWANVICASSFLLMLVLEELGHGDRVGNEHGHGHGCHGHGETPSIEAKGDADHSQGEIYIDFSKKNPQSKKTLLPELTDPILLYGTAVNCSEEEVHHHDIGHITSHLHVSLRSILSLFFALIFHSILLGFSISVTGSNLESTEIIIAVLAHKIFAGFSLGGAAANVTQDWKPLLKVSIAFAASAPLGIIVGMFVPESVTETSVWSNYISPVIKAVVAGVFLYISVLEIGAKELLMSSGKKMGSKRLHLTKLLAYAMGFAMMSSIALFI